RTLVDDLGEALGCGAHVTMLRRLAVADYPIEKMMTLGDLQNLAENQPLVELDQLLLPMDSAVARLPSLDLTDEQTKAVGFGQRVKFDNPQGIYGQVRLFSAEKLFLGIAEITADNVIRPSRMVNR
ncbi:tRNA pseudouridine(55) synthase TruB, partial [Glaesserella parasuis]|uniref:tRNA pseudouridine(55) synthase TruB n=1 Tax=Glaesserella parasuis TaxID=738 RepID=UPI003853ACE1